MSLKRNQIEDAIIGSLGLDPRPSNQDVLTRIKRLLDTDRKLQTRPYAFFSSKPSGKGVEVEFSEFEAFALLLGVRLLDHGFPQQSVVQLLRTVRRDLEKEHKRIMRLAVDGLFDQQAIEANATAGSPAHTNRDPAFLVIEVGREAEDPTGRTVIGEHHICTSEADVMRVIKSKLGATHTVLETVTSAFVLHANLALTQPRRRGPTGRKK